MFAVRILVCAAILAAVSNLSFPQIPTAQITGVVSDPTGAVVPGAQMTIVNTGTGVKRNSVSNDSGNYTVPLLDPGNYELTTTKDGFRPISRSGITLHVGQVARIDLVMELGSVSEAVQITGEAPLVESETSSL